jgi:hypothetical protein
MGESGEAAPSAPSTASFKSPDRKCLGIHLPLLSQPSLAEALPIKANDYSGLMKRSKRIFSTP